MAGIIEDEKNGKVGKVTNTGYQISRGLLGDFPRASGACIRAKN